MPKKKVTATTAKKSTSTKAAAKPTTKRSRKTTKSSSQPAAKKPTRTTTKKPTTKKTTAKTKKTTKSTRGTGKTSAKKPVKDLVYASDHESFWVTNGDILNSLLALEAALGQMERDVYQFHAAGEQNDFSVWVESVLFDSDCAAALSKAKTPKSARTAVVKHLKFYSY